MIKFIEKEPYKNYDNWNERECLMYPNVMIKEGKEYFVFNRREPDQEYKKMKNQKILNKLKETDGKYTIFYGDFENPFEMLKDIIVNKHLIISNKDIIFDKTMTDEESIDFHGNRDVYASAFMYRIFDKDLEKDLREIVTLINNKEWEKAEIELQQRREKYKDWDLNCDERQKYEELEQ